MNQERYLGQIQLVSRPRLYKDLQGDIEIGKKGVFNVPFTKDLSTMAQGQDRKLLKSLSFDFSKSDGEGRYLGV